jgi:hypothetical protein
MIAPPHPLDDPFRVLLEVNAINERAGWKSGPIENYELELLGQWPLLHPRGVAVPDAAVNKDDSFHSPATLASPAREYGGSGDTLEHTRVLGVTTE